MSAAKRAKTAEVTFPNFCIGDEVVGTTTFSREAGNKVVLTVDATNTVLKEAAALGLDTATMPRKRRRLLLIESGQDNTLELDDFFLATSSTIVLVLKMKATQAGRTLYGVGMEYVHTLCTQLCAHLKKRDDRTITQLEVTDAWSPEPVPGQMLEGAVTTELMLDAVASPNFVTDTNASDADTVAYHKLERQANDDNPLQVLVDRVNAAKSFYGVSGFNKDGIVAISAMHIVDAAFCDQ